MSRKSYEFIDKHTAGKSVEWRILTMLTSDFFSSAEHIRYYLEEYVEMKRFDRATALMMIGEWYACYTMWASAMRVLLRGLGYNYRKVGIHEEKIDEMLDSLVETGLDPYTEEGKALINSVFAVLHIVQKARG